MSIRFDDFPSGIRPIKVEFYEIYDDILNAFRDNNLPIHLGVVAELLDDKSGFLLKYNNICYCQHGFDHQYPKYSKILLEANDPFNSKTVGVFDEFEGQSLEEIKTKLISANEKLENYFSVKVNTYIPVCNIANVNTIEAIKQIGYEKVLSQTPHKGLPVQVSDYYGRLYKIDYLKKPKTFCFHISWESDVIREIGWNAWLTHFKKFVDYYKSVHKEANKPKVQVDIPKREKPFNLLFKFPIRQRVEKLFSTLDKYYDFIQDKDNFQFVINIDTDDKSLNNKEVLKRLGEYHNLIAIVGNSTNKIAAVNINMPEDGWDICVLVSDDMIPQVKGFDNVIRDKMQSYFPDTDGVLFFNDGHRQKELNTLCIFGIKYYQRFGYIYNPQYKTVACDREFTQVADDLKKQAYFPEVIIEHQHPCFGYMNNDSLYKKNEIDAYADDRHYHYRKSINFPLGIPKIAYFYWNISTPLSYLRYQTLTTFRKLHPDWIMRLYYNDTNDNSQQWVDMPKQDFTEYKGEDYIMQVKKLGVEVVQYEHSHKLNPNYISDLFRYEQLYKTGGWWLDLDQLVLKPFDRFCDNYEFIFGGTSIVYNGVIGASYHSPICLAVIERQKELLKEARFENYCMLGNWCLSGLHKSKPHLFGGAKILQVGDQIFYPILESHNAKDLYEGKVNIDSLINSYAIHYFGGHPDTQNFNKIFTPEFAKTSNDSISEYLRKNEII